MGIFLKKLLRDIKGSKGQFISIFVIVTIGVMFYSGINGTYRNLSGARDKYYQEYRFGDIWVDVYRAPEGIVKRIEAIPGVKMVSGRIVKDASINISGENATLRFITLPDVKEDIVNDIEIRSGRYFSEGESSQCLVDERFFKENGLKTGDYIYPIINGNKVKMKVVGSVKGPEFVYPLKDGSELVPDNKKFGIIYIKNSFGQAIFGFNGSINSISVLLDKDADIENTKDEIEKALKIYGVANIIESKDQLSNNMLNAEIEGLKSMGGAFPVVFFIVAAAIIYIMMGRMIENQRIQIGVLKALGFNNLQILFHYLSYSVLIAVLGSAAGSILGMYLAGGLTKLENIYFNLPLSEMKIYMDLVLPASSLTFFFCLLAGYNSCKVVFKIMPGEAMRPKSPKTGRKVLLEKLDIIWNNLSQMWRIIIRNILRYKRRALMTSTGVVFSTALLVIAFGMKYSVDYLVEQQYENIQNYDIKVNFSRLINVKELDSIKSIPHVVKMEPVLETGVEISNGWRKKNIGFTALISNPEIYRVTDNDGKPIPLPSKGIMLPERLAEKLGVRQGDTVYIKPFFPGKEKKEVPIKGIAAQYIGLGAYTSMDNVNNIFGEGMVANAAVLKLDDSAFEGEVKNKLKDYPGASSVQSKTDSLNSLVENMSAMNSEIGIFILLAAVLSIAVLYNIATINIFERQRELATLKVLGFKDNEIKKLIFYENYIITMLGMLVALPLGKWLGNYMMGMSSTDAYYFKFIINYKVYLLSIILTFLFTALANSFLMRKIKSISMVETLKSGE